MTVTDAVYDEQQPIIYDIKAEVGAALSDFYRSHVEGNLQIFHSLTVGEIIICILLAAIILLYVFHWIWEAIRY
ncbi:hypothetical protein [Paenibacillus sp. 7516]|uniref:hypothetical protein n=1 Tax=Paenibacillus sp. 7516 TaxID=2022549 RepID=UPI000BA4F38C|nr:hypothetical protein [Paenibacillus sp. 7516]PAF30778.1 hypothetical protein CHI14_15950 [Paenibacillus sp. 7516]